jgi:hypothetical protein
MATSPVQKFTCFRDAYCSYRRCRPEEFEGKVFLSTLQPFRLLAALPFYLFHRRLFAMDLETIRAVGRASRRQEVNTILEEFHNYNRLDRSRRRGMFKIRTSGTRLMSLFLRFEPMVSPPTVENPLAGVKHLTNTQVFTLPVNSGNPLRKVRQVLTGLASGRDLSALLLEADLNRDEFLNGLSTHAADNPGFSWLHRLITSESRLTEAQSEISELQRTIASQSRELARLKDTIQVADSV